MAKMMVAVVAGVMMIRAGETAMIRAGETAMMILEDDGETPSPSLKTAMMISGMIGRQT